MDFSVGAHEWILHIPWLQHSAHLHKVIFGKKKYLSTFGSFFFWMSSMAMNMAYKFSDIFKVGDDDDGDTSMT